MANVTVEGVAAVVNALNGADKGTFGAVMVAIEKTANRMAQHARAGHERGSHPHARNRFETQTANLHNSIFPGGPDANQMQWEKVTQNEIIGLFGVLPTASAVMEYAPWVESRYPFVWPAAHAKMDEFKAAIAELVKGAVVSGKFSQKATYERKGGGETTLNITRDL